MTLKDDLGLLILLLPLPKQVLGPRLIASCPDYGVLGIELRAWCTLSQYAELAYSAEPQRVLVFLFVCFNEHFQALGDGWVSKCLTCEPEDLSLNPQQP